MILYVSVSSVTFVLLKQARQMKHSFEQNSKLSSSFNSYIFSF